MAWSTFVFGMTLAFGVLHWNNGLIGLERLGVAAAQTGAAGYNTLDQDFKCAAFVWDGQNRRWDGRVGFSTAVEAEKATMDLCYEDSGPDNNCTVQLSWCTDDCVAIARSYDKVWFAWNTNPVSATKAAAYALNECTQMVCDDPAWATECKSGQPVCYVRATVCGSEYQMWNYTDNNGENVIVTLGVLDFPNDPLLIFTSPNNTILSMNVPLNGSSIPYDARPVPHGIVSVDPGAPYPPTPNATTTEDATGSVTTTEDGTTTTRAHTTATSTKTAASTATAKPSV